MIDKDLLWQAFPSGYLAVRGVSTVGGWQCAGFARDGITDRWLQPKTFFVLTADHKPLLEAHSAGDLLPNVDPSDTATWACLLSKLAQFVDFSEGYSYGFTWGGDEAHGQWVLSNGDNESYYFPDIDDDDPSLALVMAIIWGREYGQ